MSGLICAVTFVIMFLILWAMLREARHVNLTNFGLFKDWRDALNAYREAKTLGERAWLIGLYVVALLLRGGMWAFLGTLASAAATVLAALCGADWVGILKELRLILRDIYRTIRSDLIHTVLLIGQFQTNFRRFS